MKTSTAIQWLGLGLNVHFAIAVPIKAETSANPANQPRDLFWNLNCTNGQLTACANLGTYCSGSWVATNNAWCSQNCDCYYTNPCFNVGCNFKVDEKTVTEGKTDADTKTVSNTAETVDASA
ncbi:hypothetical protein VF21_10407 [Pseudogymnoascus sp. 05NY08]|nr:hypothetical protein VF21_10407 [Pseudogymnoascus sp. 05NY08]